MGFGMAPRRCGIHSKPPPLLKKTCLSYTSETPIAYVGVCLLLGSKTLETNVLELRFVLCWQTMIKT